MFTIAVTNSCHVVYVVLSFNLMTVKATPCIVVVLILIHGGTCKYTIVLVDNYATCTMYIHCILLVEETFYSRQQYYWGGGGVLEPLKI